jgi:hypothetical protein
VHVSVTRLVNGPIIGLHLHPSIGVIIQGPSLIRVPDWIEHCLGAYYLYFAVHKGSYIRLAYADHLEQWTTAGGGQQSLSVWRISAASRRTP